MLEALKQQVLQTALQAERSGLCKHRAGNFSARDAKTGYVCITPSGADREELHYDDICVMDLDANVLEMKPQLKPTSEALMHLAVYRSRADIGAVAHTHSRFATSFAVLKKEIPAIVYEVTMLGCKQGYVPLAPYGRPGSAALAESVARSLDIADVALMENHGVIAVGATLKDALLKAQYVEELAEIYYRALSINGGAEPPTVPLSELRQWAYPEAIKMTSS